ncbi:hypothetical protein R20233_04648 [Ralstonia sp. LMG 32965]|uniref:DUF4019 domain-containing protein n=1 Tax=Ralstonia flatus TaxID=3058601 RepID=UPI0028F4EF27|nr:DUF4019 domain-containing protein [Ralstonia sp. LMG 32965]CAJ0901684.1 hypothetical protein R20233_04648 [Ralstonia sp. LMG 32965]
MRARRVLFCATIVFTVLAAARAHAAPGTSADEILQLADRIAAQFEMAQYGAVWDGAAPMIRWAVDKAAFVRQLQATHKNDGSVLDRGWASIARIQYQNNRDIPDGLYANVDYAVHLKNGGVTYQLISLRLEEDGHWHFVGDARRQRANGIPTQPAIFLLSPDPSAERAPAR